MNGYGYGDRNFETSCPKCQVVINHDLLRVAKFKKDTENLIMRDYPLGGTILCPTEGTPDAGPADKAYKFATTFPNRLVKTAIRSQILELTKSTIHNASMNDVKDLIEDAIKDRDIIKIVNGLKRHESSALSRESRIAIRKMMSRYWENSSIFALELGGAVIRQSVFVEKMHQIDWVHSPTAKETMERLLTKYSRFIEIMCLYPKNVCVPTLDVDLAWHTHQLCPQRYYNYTMGKCKKFIDHDDKMDENALSSGFEWASKMYEKHYQEVYSECTCWYCEGTSSSPFLSPLSPIIPSHHQTNTPRPSNPHNPHLNSKPSPRSLQTRAHRQHLPLLTHLPPSPLPIRAHLLPPLHNNHPPPRPRARPRLRAFPSRPPIATRLRLPQSLQARPSSRSSHPPTHRLRERCRLGLSLCLVWSLYGSVLYGRNVLCR